VVAATFLTPFVLQTAPWRDTTVYFEWIRSLSFNETSATVSHAFWHLTLLNGILPGHLLSDATVTLLAPAWSISLEWQYYLAAPLLARLVRSVAGLLFLTAFAWLGLRFGHLWTNPKLAFLPAQLPLFVIGIGSFYLYKRFSESKRRRSSAIAIPVATVLALSILTGWHIPALTLWAIAFGCIFVQGNDLFSKTLSILRASLLHRCLQRLGRISYPVYLVHWPLIIGCLAAFLYWRPGLSSLQALLLLLSLGLPLILIVASILHRCIERPMMNFGKRVNSQREPRAE